MTSKNLLTEQASKILAYKAVSAEQVRALEGKAAEAAGCSLFDLMCRAGATAYQHMLNTWPNVNRILVLAGNGNNAGDAYILASLALKHGLKVLVICEDVRRTLLGDAGRAQQQWIANGGTCQSFEQLKLDEYELVIDGLLGTGLSSQLKASFNHLIHCINQSAIPVLSLDLPSGMHADTGQALPICINASLTVTFIAPKSGLLTGAGKEYCGQLVVDDLGVGNEFYELADISSQSVDWLMLKPLRTRPTHGNKGTFGKVLCIGGNQGMSGAIRLSAEAALRSGAGMVKVLCHPDSRLQVAMGRPEIMLNQQDLRSALNWCSSVVIGPGLGRDKWAVEIFHQLFSELKLAPKPLIIDADALNLLSQERNSQDLQPCISGLPACVVTPHPGEAARLLDTDVRKIESDRYAAVQKIAKAYQVTTVLKGAGSLIFTPETQYSWVCQGGNPGMATAGMGDLLTGVIGALLGQGMSAEKSAIYGVCIHAEAGDRNAHEYGQAGLIASDLFAPIRKIINEV